MSPFIPSPFSVRKFFLTTRVRKFDFLGVLFQCRLESNLKKKIPREIIQNAFSSIQDKTLNDRKL